MIHEMRRNDRQLDHDTAEKILREGEYGILSTISEDNTPYGVPLSYAYADGVIYFHGAKGVGHKIENITKHTKVCFTVVGKTQVLPDKFSTNYESVIVFGTAFEPEDKRKGLQLIIQKYSPDFMEKGTAYIEKALDNVGLYAVKVEHMTGKGRK